jgi:hypothetical protein
LDVGLEGGGVGTGAEVLGVNQSRRFIRASKVVQWEEMPHYAGQCRIGGNFPRGQPVRERLDVLLDGKQQLGVSTGGGIGILKQPPEEGSQPALPAVTAAKQLMGDQAQPQGVASIPGRRCGHAAQAAMARQIHALPVWSPRRDEATKAGHGGSGLVVRKTEAGEGGKDRLLSVIISCKENL